MRQRKPQPAPAPDRYTCAICGAVKVVPSLARLCENFHAEVNDD